MSPALEDEFLSAGASGKSLFLIFKSCLDRHTIIQEYKTVHLYVNLKISTYSFM